ncbi:MAG: hypothetical protein E7167_03640 [Firmicutes bacterium]|nr:hypothetical protein [Bacillota bacterium]
MDKIIRNILKKIENEGYEAYIVGGFVRDKLLKGSSYDVDICTNALPMNLKNIFSISQNGNGYGGYNLKIKKYNIDITTYRKEKKYNNRRPIEVEYINNLFEDIKRRDFTINSLCMDKNDNIIDLLGGKKDLDNRIIKVIGNAEDKFREDPLRMLRAIRFATILDFEIEESTFNGICNNSMLVSTLSSERIKEEIAKILSSPHVKRGLDLLSKTGIDKVIGLSYNNITFTSDILGMWAQIEVKKINFTKTEKDSVNQIRTLIKIGKINNFELFNYGLYLCLVAGEILNIDHQTVNRRYKNLPIKSMKDIDINGAEIIKLLKIEPSKLISEIMSDIKIEILNKRLKNRKHEIKKYILRKWQNE